MRFLLILFFSCQTFSPQKKTTEINSPIILEDEDYLTIDTLLNHPELTDQSDFIPDADFLQGSFLEKEHHLKDIYILKSYNNIKLTNIHFDIPVEDREEVDKWVHYFLTQGRNFFLNYSKRAGRYAPLMSEILDQEGLPKDLIYMAMAESGFQTKAKSWARAIGPWQFMPFTGKKYGLKINWYVDERRDPVKATYAATRYLKDLFHLFHSWELALAAYNVGEGRVSRVLKKSKQKDFWSIRKFLPRETRDYVPKIMALAILGKNLNNFDLKEDHQPHRPLTYNTIEVLPRTDLDLVAEKLGISFDLLHYLNPELLRWMTPPDKSYSLKIPMITKHPWQESYQSLVVATDFKEYRLKQGETLKSVAKIYRLSEEILKEMNPKLGPVIQLPFKKEHHLKEVFYADLYEPVYVKKSRGKQQAILATAQQRGKLITRPKEYYTVKKGDTLWTVAKKKEVSFYTLLKNNSFAIKHLKPGDKLVIR